MGDPANDANENIFGEKNSGLNFGEERRGLEGLFGRGFSAWGQGSLIHEDPLCKVQENMPQLTLVNLKWEPTAHAVAVTRVDSDRVYFRNPWGETTEPKGTMYSSPPRRLENPDIREESMTLSDFRNILQMAFVPS